MFNENKISENRVCYLDGKADAIAELVMTLQIKNRRVIKLDELERLAKSLNIEYERAWNKWADKARIGGSRYDETGVGKARE